jgi:hypothetical protein
MDDLRWYNRALTPSEIASIYALNSIYSAKSIVSNGSIISLGGNIGIGSTSPVTNLDITKTTTTGTPALEIRGGGGGPRLQVYGRNADAQAWMGFGTDMAGGPYENSVFFPNANSGTQGFLTLGSYNGSAYSEKMRILVGGNIGIGKTNPGYLLDVNGYVRCNARDQGFLLGLDGAMWDNSRWWMDGGATYIDFGGMENGFRIRGNNDNSTSFPSQTYTEHLKIQARSGTGMTFGTGGVAFAMAGCSIDRVWDNYPCISVHNTAGNGATLQGEFRVHGAAMTYSSYPDASGGDFSVNFRIDGGTYFTSDRRAKSNITSITDALDIVMKLDGKRFQRINSDGEVQEHVSENSYKFGFIAQELQSEKIDELYLHYPAEDDGTNNYNNSFSVDYSSLVAVLVNAMKEQQAQINLLKKRLDARGL